jgi:hypothetical protein
MFDIGWKVYLDEAAMGDLKTGTFVYSDRPAGPHQLFFARPGDLSRGSQQSFSAAPGRTYFFRLDMNEKRRLVAASGGAVGQACWCHPQFRRPRTSAACSISFRLMKRPPRRQWQSFAWLIDRRRAKRFSSAQVCRHNEPTAFFTVAPDLAATWWDHALRRRAKLC